MRVVAELVPPIFDGAKVRCTFIAHSRSNAGRPVVSNHCFPSLTVGLERLDVTESTESWGFDIKGKIIKTL